MASLGELERAVMDLLWSQTDSAAEDAALTANTLRDRLARSSSAA
ncbi:transcriptional regulator, partial [Arthrobacter deserti]|nr:transcriptional regulator [Arthrobacter deserti]